MKRYLIIFLIGAFSSLSMAPTNFWPAIFVGLSTLYIYVTLSSSTARAALSGFMFSLGYFGFGLSWVGNALLVEDNPYWWAWPIAVSGLPLILSLFTALSCAVHKYICKSNNNIWTYLSFSSLIMLSEYARGNLFTGFPWNLYGYTWIDILPIAQLASLWNIYILTAATILWAVFPAFIVTYKVNNKFKILLTIPILASVSLSYIYGQKRIENYINSSNKSNISIVLVQPNIKQSEKWKPENISKNFMSLIELSQYKDEDNKSDDKKTYLIIWPETAISQGILNAPWAMNQIRIMLKSYPDTAYLVSGALRYEEKTKNYYNSVVIFDDDAKIIQIYNKSHLVPFGEYMPLSNIFDIAPIVGFTGFKKGDGKNILQLPNDINIGAMVCYEIIFPKYAKFKKAERPQIIINTTNDAWYGNSSGPYQHLAQTQFRAIESGLPVIRSANTGISAIIDPTGKINNYVPLEVKNIINQKVKSSIDIYNQSN